MSKVLLQTAMNKPITMGSNNYQHRKLKKEFKIECFVTVSYIMLNPGDMLSRLRCWCRDGYDRDGWLGSATMQGRRYRSQEMEKVT